MLDLLTAQQSALGRWHKHLGMCFYRKTINDAYPGIDFTCTAADATNFSFVKERHTFLLIHFQFNWMSSCCHLCIYTVVPSVASRFLPLKTKTPETPWSWRFSRVGKVTACCKALAPETPSTSPYKDLFFVSIIKHVIQVVNLDCRNHNERVDFKSVIFWCWGIENESTNQDKVFSSAVV